MTTTDKSIFTLNDIVDKLGHRGRELSVFKIDCERCEWDTFETWLDAGVHIREILAEVHAGTELPSDNPVARQFMAFMFERNMLIFHKEPNVKYSGGNSLCVEYGFVRTFRTTPSGVVRTFLNPKPPPGVVRTFLHRRTGSRAKLSGRCLLVSTLHATEARRRGERYGRARPLACTRRSYARSTEQAYARGPRRVGSFRRARTNP